MRRSLGFCGTAVHPCYRKKVTYTHFSFTYTCFTGVRVPVRLFRLVRLRWGGSGRFIWKELLSWTMIERWLQLRFIRVRHSEIKATWEVAIVMSGEVGSPRERTRVGESMLRSLRSEFVIRVPLASASVLRKHLN